MGKHPEWQPIETAPPPNTWVVGRLDGEGCAPAFVGQVYKNPFHAEGLSLIDGWTGKWKQVTAWMPLPFSEGEAD